MDLIKENGHLASEAKIKNMYKLGIIGFGGMARNHYKQLSNKNVPVEIKGVFDIDPQKMADAAEKGLFCYESREALLSDPELDIVLIAVPNHLHRDFSIEALRAGKHVLCEKPVTITSAELMDIMAVADEVGKIFTIDQNRRVNKDYVLMRRTVEAGHIGKPYLIESRVEGSRGVPEGWRTSRAEGGGMLLDWGVHLIDQITYMYPERKVTSVYCQMLSLNYPEVDDNFRLIMTLEGGLTAQIEVATNNFLNHPRWYVLGTGGTLIIDDWMARGRFVNPTSRENTWTVDIAPNKAGPSKTMAARDPSTVHVTELEAPTDITDNLDPTYEQLVAAIEGKAPLKITAEQALRVVKIMEAAFASAEKNQVIHTDI